MKFSIKDFFSKWDQIRSFLRIWSHLLKKSFMENFIFLCQYINKSTITNHYQEIQMVITWAKNFMKYFILAGSHVHALIFSI